MCIVQIAKWNGVWLIDLEQRDSTCLRFDESRGRLDAGNAELRLGNHVHLSGVISANKKTCVRTAAAPLPNKEIDGGSAQGSAWRQSFGKHLRRLIPNAKEELNGICRTEKCTYHWETIIASAVFGGIRHLEAQYMERGCTAVEARKAYD
ncbi:hypothetical protein K438DRAFT_1769114 [Mycena galopus ATCC 62051]|nr:hypothetical protein K438DRAFT_1769114 [Mycena galopus ATCC 62051]